MATRTDEYRAALRKLKDWEPYLKKHSGLPGPRANLELLAAVVEEADADRLWRLSASADEYLATVGTAGLGRIALMEPETVMTWLRELASDPRWRVREGVAMALQRLGKESMPKLLAEMDVWAQDDAFVQRAVVAGLSQDLVTAAPKRSAPAKPARAKAKAKPTVKPKAKAKAKPKAKPRLNPKPKSKAKRATKPKPRPRKKG